MYDNCIKVILKCTKYRSLPKQSRHYFIFYFFNAFTLQSQNYLKGKIRRRYQNVYNTWESLTENVTRHRQNNRNNLHRTTESIWSCTQPYTMYFSGWNGTMSQNTSGKSFSTYTIANFSPVCVKTEEWTTYRTHCCIGVFLWCHLSCIMFLAVCNLCLDLIDQSSKHF